MKRPSGRITITIMARSNEDNPYDLFPNMADTGMGAMTIMDDNGNPVDFPDELTNELLRWAGYDR